MKKKSEKSGRRRGIPLIVSIVLVFCILGTVVYSVAQKISEEMSESAITNLNESLNLIKGMVEAIYGKEAEFQKLIAQEIASIDDPEEFIRSYNKNNTMVKLSLIAAGETEGVSNTGSVFTEKELDFSAGKTIDGLEISESYLNSMGTWAYTMKCPVIRDGEEIATFYIEYIYDSLEEVLPDGFYNGKAMLYIMDSESERLVLKPKGMGERNAGHLNLQDFYHANRILEKDIQSQVFHSVRNGKNVMFYHDILGRDSLIYMWAVNDGGLYLIGYVPIEAIQQEGRTVNQNIIIVIIVMMAAFIIGCLIY